MRYFRSAGLLFLIGACGVLRLSLPTQGSAQELSRTEIARERHATTTNKLASNAVDEIAPAHPLMAVIKFARAEKGYLHRNVRSLSCRLVKRERIDGELQDYQYIKMELQEEIRSGNVVVRPMRAFLSFLGPSEVKGRKGLTFHAANVYVDSEWHVPVRIDASDWPEEPAGACPLLAEYTYTDVQLNVDFSEATFDEDRLKQ